MNKIFIFKVLIVLVLWPILAIAEPIETHKNYNPDGKKFEFTRSFLSSLSYFYAIESRWKKSESLKESSSDMEFIRWNMDRLSLENMDIRVAKNYMAKYFQVDNALMKKSVDVYINTCDQLIELNQEDRKLWEQLKQWKDENSFDGEKDQSFVLQQERLALKRKNIMSGLIESAVFVSKILLSEDTQERRSQKRLAISIRDRGRLVKKLDGLSRGNFDWGLQEGQTFLQAAEAVIREVLEDPAYLSADESVEQSQDQS